MATHAKKPDPDAPESLALESFLPFQLAVVANRVSQAIAKLIETNFDLHIPEWRMLALLANHAPLSAHEVADRTAMDRARVSRAQQRLVELDLIDAMVDRHDRRKVNLRLTRRGTEIVRKIVPEALKMEAEILSSLSEKERRAFEVVLKKLFEQTIRVADYP